VFALLLSLTKDLDAAAAVKAAVEWLQSVHAQSPGAAVFLVCSRAESPPDGIALDAWQADVSEFARAVLDKVPRR
jgi:uncharacterized protein YgbK (DUF1537 family)